MNLLEQKIRDFAKQKPQKTAIQGETSGHQKLNLSYQQLVTEIETLSSVFGLDDKSAEPQQQSFAIIMDNHPAWAVLDLSLFFQQQCAVPLPKFFSNEQLKHALLDARVNHLIIGIDEDSLLLKKLLFDLSDVLKHRSTISIAGKDFYWFRVDNSSAYTHLPQSHSHSHSHSITVSNTIRKITYTSGTTAQPKGVMLSEQAILSKVVSLADACEAGEADIALSILPLSTLLENIGGLYVPLFCGARVSLLAPERIGISGSSQINSQQLMNTLNNYKPTVFIIIPQLLLLLINLVKKGWKLPDSIRFIAMGGAPVSKNLLQLAQQLKIPVYEGYGLSEAASVVAVNKPGHNRLGSVGRVLNSHQVKISPEGEILIKQQLFSGYLGETENKSIEHEFYATGDIGKIDEDGFIYVTGRRKNVVNTSYGRNISPEWIEKELEAMPMIAQCLIYGHAKPYLVAILVLRQRSDKESGKEDMRQNVHASLEQLNTHLPDYARVVDFILTDTPFSIQNKQLTGTGRPRREVIYKAYQNELDQCYLNQEVH